jgi:hypothetical protein
MLGHQKTAVDPYAPAVSEEFAAHNNRLKADILRRALYVGLGGAGLGALTALPALLRGAKVPAEPAPSEVGIPESRLRTVEESERKKKKRLAEKSSSTLYAIAEPLLHAGAQGGLAALRPEKGDRPSGVLRGSIKGLVGGLAALPGVLGGHAAYDRFLGPRLSAQGSAVKLLARLLSGAGGGLVTALPTHGLQRKAVDVLTGEKRSGVADMLVSGLGLATKPGQPVPATLVSPRWWRGDTQTRERNVPWAVPLVALSGVGGFTAGHALLRYLAKKKRKSDLQADLDAAQKEYETALLSQYDPSRLKQLSPKEAAAPDVLGDCFDKLEKKGDFNSLLGLLGGPLLLGAGSAALLSGLGTYRALSGYDKAKLLEEAMRRRAIIRSLQSPTEMHVHPVVPDVVARGNAPKEEGEE